MMIAGMPIFYGELQERTDTQRLPAVVTVENGSIRLVSGRTELGEWQLSQVAVEQYTDQSVLFRADDDELILFLSEQDRFLAETTPVRRAEPKKERRRPTHPAFRKDQGDAVQELREDVDREVAGIVGEVRHLLSLIPGGPPMWIGLGVFLLLLIFLPAVLAGIGLIGGVLGLGLGALAYADTNIALRIPDPFTPQLLLGLGALLLALGVVVWVVR